MDALVEMKCTACRKGEPTVTDAEIAVLHPQVPAKIRGLHRNDFIMAARMDRLYAAGGRTRN